jgi:hypothetical protein
MSNRPNRLAAGPNIHELLLKELDERHLYSRFIAQAYLAWYTFFVTLNLTIMGVSFAYADKIALTFRLFLAGSFLLFNALAIFMTAFILGGTENQQKRIKKIIDALDTLCRKNPISQAIIEVRSPYPHTLFEWLSLVFASSLFALYIAWSIYGAYLLTIGLSNFRA